MIMHTKFALTAFLVLGLLVLGAAAQERLKSPPLSESKAEKLSPELQEGAKKLGAWLTGGEFMRDKDYEKAAEVFKQAIRLWPDEANWHYYLGMCYGELGRYQEAEVAYKQAIRLDPNDYNSIFSLGFIYMRMGRHEEAVTAFKQAIPACKQAIRHNPDNVQAHYCLGMLYLTLKGRPAAFEEYKILQTLDKKMANELFNSIYK